MTRFWAIAAVGMTLTYVISVMLVAGALIYSKSRAERALNKKNKKQLAEDAPKHKFLYSSIKSVSSQKGSYNDRNSEQVLAGKLKNSQNKFTQFLQTESRSSSKEAHSGDRSTSSRRIITEVEIPNTLANFVIRSNAVDREESLDSFDNISDDNIIALQGEFSRLFKTYAPDQDRVQLLVVLQPNAMEILIANFTAYDIEIDGSSLLFYGYDAKTADDRFQSIKEIDELVSAMKLSGSDSKVFGLNSDEAVLLSRTATNDNRQAKLNKKSQAQSSATGLIALIVLFIAPNIVLVALFAPGEYSSLYLAVPLVVLLMVLIRFMTSRTKGD